MAIDTAAKRCSAIATRRLPWFRRFMPIPSGSVDQADQQQVLLVYGGILAGELVGVSGTIQDVVNFKYSYSDVVRHGTDSHW